jgi:4-amino-4-deoxy-L-arabinose transferase-like glycosyltransferase
VQQLFSAPWKVLTLLTGLALVMRFFSFFPSVIDHDESTYILIADAIRQGQVYLRDVIDTKPIGIFLLFAVFQSVFGKAIITIRIITAIWVALTAWVLYLTHRKLLRPDQDSDSNGAPVASGIIYVFVTSVYTFYGVSPNTELFFTLCTISALLLLLTFSQSVWFGMAGLLLGMGFLIKYVVVFDAIALGLFYIGHQITSGRTWGFVLSRMLVMGFGFMLPILGVWMYYYFYDLDQTFWFFFFGLSGRYFIDPPWHAYLIYLGDTFLRFLPVSVWFFYCLWDRRSTGHHLVTLGWLWGGLVMIIILLPGKLFGHYYIQFLLPMSLVAGSFFDPGRHPPPVLAWMRRPTIGYPLLVLILLVSLFFQKTDYVDKPDYPKEVAAFLNTHLLPGDILYTGDYHPIVYHLTGTKSPTPYIHRSLVWGDDNNEALQIRKMEEWEKIMVLEPRFILLQHPVHDLNPLYALIQHTYRVTYRIEGQVEVFERQ